MENRFFRSRLRVVVLVCAALVALQMPSTAQRGPAVDSGVSPERVQRIGQLMDRHIAAGNIPGAVTLVARKGRIVHFEARGLADLASRRPMARDTVFELFSMTKPIVATAIMILAEEGRLTLNDPVGKFVPEYQRLSVRPVPASGAESTNGSGATEPQVRPITLGDVLTHTAGLANGTLAIAVDGAAPPADVAQTPRRPTDTLADYVPRMAVAPLRFQPGTQWAYSGILGFDLLARVVEVASGYSFDRFLRERVFAPLKMPDTAHNLTETQAQRVATRYQLNEGTLTPVITPYTRVYFGGGWGLKGTAGDYFRFAQMLLNKGQLDGVRILSPRGVELLARPVIPDTLPGRPVGEAYGLGVRVVAGGANRFGGGAWLANGSYGWQGAAGTCFFIDPTHEVVGIVLTATNGACAQPTAVLPAFEAAVIQAIVGE
jgi:CubicO group peptidase (beta-lactamase class C family)